MADVARARRHPASAKFVTASLAESIAQQVETTLKTADTVVATLVQRAEVDGSIRRACSACTG